jgi:cytochrome P450
MKTIGAAADDARGPVRWNPYDRAIYASPYEAYRRLREEAPIYHDEEHDFFAVSRYEDVKRVLRDRETFTSLRGDLLELLKADFEMPSGMFIYEEAPEHTIHRGLMTRVFTPKRMAALEPAMRAYCAAALDPFLGEGKFDFVANLGAEMPMRVIGMLLGIPEQEQKRIQRYLNEAIVSNESGVMSASRDTMSGEIFAEYVDWRVKNPSDDLMTQLLHTEFTDEKGERKTLRRDQVLIFVNILAGAGNDTTNRLIGWIGKTLADHPDQRRDIYQNRALIPQAIEEVLRFEPPPYQVARYVERDAEFHGVTVPAGSAIVALPAAANRDQRVFGNGDDFNIHRDRQANLSFGFGLHSCLGNVLARSEGRVALDEILKRFPEWEIDIDKVQLASTTGVRGWDAMPAYVVGAGNGAGR